MGGTGGATPAGKTVVSFTVYGDANLDHTTDISDFGIWKSQVFNGDHWAQGDFNYDGTVDITDFGIWKANAFNGTPFVAAKAGGTSSKASLAASALRASANGPVTLTSTGSTSGRLASGGG